MDKSASYAFALPREQVTFVTKPDAYEIYFGLRNDDPARLEKAARLIEKYEYRHRRHQDDHEEERHDRAAASIKQELKYHGLDVLLVNADENGNIIPACQIWDGRVRYYFEHLFDGKACPGPADAKGRLTESSAMFHDAGEWRQWRDGKKALLGVRCEPPYIKEPKTPPSIHVQGMGSCIEPKTFAEEVCLNPRRDVLIEFKRTVPQIIRLGYKHSDETTAGFHRVQWDGKQSGTTRDGKMMNDLFQGCRITEKADLSTREGQINAIVNRFGFAATPMKVAAKRPVFV